MERRIPAGSQTVGPYFMIGLEYLIARTAAMEAANAIEIHGRVLDRDGAPVPDAMLEFWSAGDAKNVSREAEEHGIPNGFRRVTTDAEGRFAVKIGQPLL